MTHTLIDLALFFLQAAPDASDAAPIAAPAGNAIVEMVRNSGAVALSVLGLLAAASLFSWAIILGKLSSFRKARQQGRRFLRAFRKAGRLQEIAAVSEALTFMEQRLTWLATIGAIAPFIGLFGTVMGIVDAFHGLGTAGAATLRAVAPGVSEALITTAVGLIVAVPAVVAYNQFTARVREFGSRLDDFSREMLNSLEEITLRDNQDPLERERAREAGRDNSDREPARGF